MFEHGTKKVVMCSYLSCLQQGHHVVLGPSLYMTMRRIPYRSPFANLFYSRTGSMFRHICFSRCVIVYHKITCHYLLMVQYHRWVFIRFASYSFLLSYKIFKHRRCLNKQKKRVTTAKPQSSTSDSPTRTARYAPVGFMAFVEVVELGVRSVRREPDAPISRPLGAGVRRPNFVVSQQGRDRCDER